MIYVVPALRKVWNHAQSVGEPRLSILSGSTRETDISGQLPWFPVVPGGSEPPIVGGSPASCKEPGTTTTTKIKSSQDRGTTRDRPRSQRREAVSDMTIEGRPTMYSGTQMRSRLEADYAANLDKAGISWAYEPACFAGPDGQWLPDFRLKFKGMPNIYVELKPMPDHEILDQEYVDSLLRKMEIAWLSEPTANLHLVFWQWRQGPGARLLTLGSYEPESGLQCRAWRVDVDRCQRSYLWPGMGQTERVATHPIMRDLSDRHSKHLDEQFRTFMELDRSRTAGWYREAKLLALLENHGDPELLRRALELVGERHVADDGAERYELPAGVREVRERAKVDVPLLEGLLRSCVDREETDQIGPLAERLAAARAVADVLLPREELQLEGRAA